MNKEIEVQVIAHLLDEPKNYFANSAKLSEKLFHDPFLKSVYEAYCEVIKSGRNPNPSNLTTDDDGRIELLSIISSINFDMNFDGWLSMLVGKWKEREFSMIITRASLVKEDIDESIKNVQSKLSLLNNVDGREPSLITEHIEDVFKAIEANQARSGLTGVDTGLYLLNSFTGGWQKGDLVIVAGDTSQGKTSLALQFARVAGVSRVPVSIHSYEMSTRQLTARLMSQHTAVSSKSMLIGKLENESVNELRRKVLSLSSLPIYIDDCFSSQLNYLINSMTTINITKGVRLFVVDYLQLISNITRGGTKEQEVAGIARELKNFAKRTDSTVILLSQLSRKQNQRVGSEPKLSDLRDSGQIEEAADIVILTYRPEVYGIGQFDDGTNTDGKAELIIAKGRNIGLARFLLNFDKELTLFSNYNAESTTYNQSNTDPNF